MAAAAKRNGKPGVVVWAVRSLKGRTAAKKDMSSAAEAQDCNMLDKQSELQAFIKGLNQNTAGELARIVWLFNAELICIWSVITATLSKSEDTARKAKCTVLDSVFLSRRLLLPCRSTVAWSDQV